MKRRAAVVDVQQRTQPGEDQITGGSRAVVQLHRLRMPSGQLRILGSGVRLSGCWGGGLLVVVDGFNAGKSSAPYSLSRGPRAPSRQHVFQSRMCVGRGTRLRQRTHTYPSWQSNLTHRSRAHITAKQQLSISHTHTAGEASMR